MEKKTEKVMIEQERITYVSADGKEFENESDCKMWEKSYESTIAASMKNIKKITLTSNDFFMEYGSDDCRAFLFKPQNNEEIITVNAWLDLKCICGEDRLAFDMIDRYVIVSFGCDEDWVEVHVMEDYLQYICEQYARYRDIFETSPDEKFVF